MSTTTLRRLGCVALTASALVGAAAPAAMADVYTQTNAPTGNAVQILERAADGTLVADAVVPTGGRGTGAGLGSQGAVTLNGNGTRLYAVNAGSNDVTAFGVRPDGSLRRLEKVGSRGTTPVSVAARGPLVAVLNAGGTPSVSTFLAIGDRLIAIPGGTRALPAGAAGAAQVQFTPDGRRLVVTERGTNRLDTLRLDPLGRPGAPVSTPSNGPVPFGFDITNGGTIVVSEAANSTASSYRVLGNGVLSTISASVPTLQGAACWVVVSDDDRFAYTANASTGSITAFAIAPNGTLTRIPEDGVSARSPRPTDIALSAGDGFAYVVNSAAGVVTAYARDAQTGALTALPSTAVAPGSAGIAAL